MSCDVSLVSFFRLSTTMFIYHFFVALCQLRRYDRYYSAFISHYMALIIAAFILQNTHDCVIKTYKQLKFYSMNISVVLLSDEDHLMNEKSRSYCIFVYMIPITWFLVNKFISKANVKLLLSIKSA